MTIVLACERQQYSLILPCKTSKDAWFALKNHHEKMSTPASAAAVKKWCSMNLEAGGDVEKFIHEWEKIASKLELVVALESRDDLEMTYVKGRLIDEHKRMNEKALQDKKLF